MTPRRRGVGLLVISGLLLATTACSGDDKVGTEVPSTAGPVLDGELPPAGALDLEALYGDDLEAIGMRLTSRGGLIDRTNGGYYSSAQGTHLALYVEPIGDRTVPQYLDGIRSIAVIFAGDIFDRWPGLESFDVCQEPEESDTGGRDPLPVTQIELTRAEAAAFDFDTVTVIDLVRASLADPPGLVLRVSSQIARDPAYEAIVDEAT